MDLNAVKITLLVFYLLKNSELQFGTCVASGMGMADEI